MTTLFYFTIFLFLGLCVLLCFIVLIQESKSLGLGASFGGEASDSLFGTSTAQVLKKFTTYLVVIFMALSLLLSLWSSGLMRSKAAPLGVSIEEIESDAS